MGRPVILGNGGLTVGLNEKGLVHDFYYPYVGLDNLTNARSQDHKIGIWVDGRFSWVDDDKNWQIKVDFSSEALISDVQMINNDLQVELRSEDFVDSEANIFCRKIKVINLADKKQEIRLFMHQVFTISHSGRADTALFVPEDNYILDYKGRCSLLIYGVKENGEIYDQFAIGNYGIEGKEGTFRDAEDGELSGSPVEHGGVDSIIRFSCPLEAKAETSVDYWIIAADSQFACEKLQEKMLHSKISGRMELTKSFWHHWLAIGSPVLTKIDQDKVPMVKKSLMVIKAHIDKRGGVIASCDSSIYNYGRDYYSYVWPRDGAYAMWPLIRLGYVDEAQNFFSFCRDILSEDGYLMHKYQPDKAIGSTWHPLLHGRHKELAIQEDETAIVVFMIGEYLKHTNDVDFVRNLYDTFIKPAANFMSDFIDEQTNLPHASYDLWEEKFSTSTYTASIVYQSLLTAVAFAEDFEYPDDVFRWKTASDKISDSLDAFYNEDRNSFRKGFLLKEDNTVDYDDTIDISSMYGIMMYVPDFDSDKQQKNIESIENILLDISPSGGSSRYEHDNYFESNPAFQGNPWFVTTLWIAQYYIRNNQADKAKRYIEWTIDHALPSGVLSEQVNPTTAEPISVTPLVWSHAEFINTILDLSQTNSN